MKTQIKRKEIILETVDIEFPIYSYIEEDEFTIYTKLTKKEFRQIKIGPFEVTASQFTCDNRSISEIWYDNQCDWKTFQEGVRILKEYINDF